MVPFLTPAQTLNWQSSIYKPKLLFVMFSIVSFLDVKKKKKNIGFQKTVMAIAGFVFLSHKNLKTDTENRNHTKGKHAYDALINGFMTWFRVWWSLAVNICASVLMMQRVKFRAQTR